MYTQTHTCTHRLTFINTRSSQIDGAHAHNAKKFKPNFSVEFHFWEDPSNPLKRKQTIKPFDPDAVCIAPSDTVINIPLDKSTHSVASVDKSMRAELVRRDSNVLMLKERVELAGLSTGAHQYVYVCMLYTCIIHSNVLMLRALVELARLSICVYIYIYIYIHTHTHTH